MKYASIDIETTGLDPETCKIVEIGIVLDDLNNQLPIEKLPVFHCYVTPTNGIFTGQARALAMHGEIFDRIASKTPGYMIRNEEDVWIDIQFFFSKNGYGERERINAAGKNFASFDSRFLNKLPNFSSRIFFSHRVVDPAMLYWNPLSDRHLPDTKECYQRAGFDAEVAHTAVDDAKGVVKLIRAKIRGSYDF